MNRKINAFVQQFKCNRIVNVLIYLSIFVLLYMLSNFSRNMYSTVKETHSESTVMKIIPNKTTSKVSKDIPIEIQSKSQNDKVNSNKMTEHVDIKVNIQENNINGCIRLETLDPNEVHCNTSMFFIESNQRAASKLTARQSCSIESAARINPDRLVFVLFLSPTLECHTDITAMMSLVINYHNIRFRHIDWLTYSDNTPVQEFVRSGVMSYSKYPVEHYSDLLRIITLWKYGGIYMDLDAMSLKPIPLIDFIGTEKPVGYIASGVIGIQRKDVAEEALQMFKKKWSANGWGNAGPVLFTDLLKKRCNTHEVRPMFEGLVDCKNFTVFPPDVLYPIGWNEWNMLFNPSKRFVVKEKIKDSLSMHAWNALNKNVPIILKSGHPYEDVAKDYCPNVLKTVIDQF